MTMNAISMNGPLALDAPLALRRKNFRTNNYTDLIADSRSADANTSASGPAGLSGVHWFNWAQVLGGNRMRLLNNYGISGARSDEYLAGFQNTGVLFRGGMQMALNSPSGWLIFGYPAANDIGQASTVPYINRNGVAVTVANVAEVCASNIIAAANQALVIGKRVILSTEPGAASFNAAQVAAVHEVNLRLRAYAQATDGVYLWSPLPVLWDPATSATAIVFRAGMLRVNDFVHFSVRGGKAAGAEFARFMTTMMPALDVGIATRAEGENGSAINPRQLGRNQLFTALTGGTVAAASAGSGGGTGTIAVTGDVPAGWTLQGPAVASCTITSAAHPDGFGNKVTLDFTTTAAASVAFSCAAPSIGAWSLADTLQFGIDIEVAAGAANAHAYSNLGINTNNGGANYYTLHGSAPLEPYPIDAYAGRLLSQEARPLAGATAKSFLQGQVFATFARAGNLRITLSRSSIERLLI